MLTSSRFQRGPHMNERAKILMVDDRPENLLALEAILGPMDLDLVRANSGEEALRALLQADFALILLDAQMPGMDGFDTAARIKRRTRTKDVPIIFLTAFGEDPSSSYRGYVAGGADYISKPFDPWILRAKVQVFVDLWVAGRLQAAQAAMLRDRTDDREEALGVLRRCFADLEDAVDELASAALPEAGSSLGVAVAQVQERMAALREAFASCGVPEPESRSTSR
jgi:CheY-like chemotaxis protein